MTEWIASLKLNIAALARQVFPPILAGISPRFRAYCRRLREKTTYQPAYTRRKLFISAAAESIQRGLLSHQARSHPARDSMRDRP